MVLGSSSRALPPRKQNDDEERRAKQTSKRFSSNRFMRCFGCFLKIGSAKTTDVRANPSHCNNRSFLSFTDARVDIHAHTHRTHENRILCFSAVKVILCVKHYELLLPLGLFVYYKYQMDCD